MLPVVFQRFGRGVGGGWPSVWIGAAVVVVAGLALLALAETVWLKASLPRDHAQSARLLVFPSSGNVPDDPSAWAGDIRNSAESDGFLRALIADPALQDAFEDRPLTLKRLRESVRLNVECVRAVGELGAERRGALLSLTVRGESQNGVDVVARRWPPLFAQANPAVDVTSAAGAPGPILPCDVP